MTQNNPIEEDSYIPALQTLPEITFRGIILSIILVIILTASNAFLGLKVGLTVAASIPAAVISMGVLRFFKNSNILENNIVQTAASAGEALIAGTVYIIPALVLLGYWQNFNYWKMVLILTTGGILGVFFSVPLRRILLAHKSLKFPEGTAIGHVLKAGADGKKGSLQEMILGGAAGSAVSLAQSGFKILSEGFHYWLNLTGHAIVGVGLGFNPALLAAGYIVGIQVAVSILIGVVLCWFVALPILTHYYSGDLISTADIALSVWKLQVRYIGVGVMVTSGLWTLGTLLKPIVCSLKASYCSVKTSQKNGAALPRTEQDMSIRYIALGILLMILPVFFIVHQYANNQFLGLSSGYYWAIVAVMVLYTLVGGFIFSCVCGYFSGLVGTSNSPISAMGLGAMIIGSLLLLLLLGFTNGFNLSHAQSTAGSIIMISVCSVIMCAATISNDNIQDLKAGQMVGATPWKQQVMLIVGVIVSASVAPLVLRLLFEAYGIGNVFPHPGMDPAQVLSAPQATAMSFVVQAVFSHTLPWGMLGTGAVITLLCLILNLALHRYHFSLPALGIGMGIYLPLETNMPIVIGGIASFIIHLLAVRRYKLPKISTMETISTMDQSQNLLQHAKRRGLILACGMVAGSTIMGVILAVPFAISRSTDVLRLVSEHFENIGNLLGALVMILLVAWFYRTVCQKSSKS